MDRNGRTDYPKFSRISRGIARTALVFGALFFLPPGVFAAHFPPEVAPWVSRETHGTGTHFEVSDSRYFNVVLDSTEAISLKFQSFPEMITMMIEPVSSAMQTQITLRGFYPFATYYKYEDDYHNLTQFTADGSGAYSYTQDLSKLHFVFIQPRKSTKFIKDDATGGDCYLIGIWDSAAKTCTLTRDMSETIQIDSDNVVLDGAGHSITGSNTGLGVYVPWRTGITIKNLVVYNFTSGIAIQGSNDIILTGNTTSGNQIGIAFAGERGILRENIVSNNQIGIAFLYLGNNTLMNNTISHSGLGVLMYESNSNQIYQNNFIGNNSQAVVFNGNNNIFNLSLPAGGNYWDDFDEPIEGCHDTNRDGFCDAPRGISMTAEDAYPWTTPSGWTLPQAPARDPVIIIPGIMGTSLFKDYGDKEEIWMNLSELTFSSKDLFLSDLALLNDGLSNSDKLIKRGDIIRKVNVPLLTTDIFDSLINKLQTNGYTEGENLFVFPYDWRLDNVSNAEFLNQKIDQILVQTGAEKIDIIAHSMGGLVAKEYIVKHGKNKIDQLIFLGTPQLGAPKAFKGLMYGDNLGIPILNQDTVKQIAQNMPALHQLLPSRKYVDINGRRYITDLVTAYLNAPSETVDKSLNYDQTKNFMIMNGRNSGMFPLAEALHNEIDNLNLDGIRTYKFIGCGKATIGSIVAKKKKSTTSSLVSITDDYQLGYTGGDETVPVISARDQSTGATYYVNKVSHSNLPSAGEIPNMISNILNGQAINTSSGISTDSSVCTKISGDVVSAHSPVEVHVYDSFGNHTGPLPDGDIEYGIPDVAYDTIGEAKFAFLPEGGNYRVIHKATDIGAYDLMIQHVEDEQVMNTAYFNEIPLATLQTQSEIAIFPDQSGFTLRVDNDGDGIFEANMEPSATLNAAESQDITMPRTESSVRGTRGLRDWFVSNATLTLLASDDNSGILKTEYSLDGGITWKIYRTPIVFDGEGVTEINYFSTDRAGNIESIQIKTIKIDKTTPEVSVLFDQDTRSLRVEGNDNLSDTTVARLGDTVTVTDEAGHTTTLVFKKINEHGNEIKAKFESIQYDNLPIQLQDTKLTYEWSLDKKDGTIRELEQRIKSKKNFDIRAKYSSKNDTTKIKIDDKGHERISINGLVILKLNTNKGKVNFSY